MSAKKKTKSKKSGRQQSMTAVIKILRAKLKDAEDQRREADSKFLQAVTARQTAVNQCSKHAEKLETQEVTLRELNEQVTLKTEVIEELGKKSKSLEADRLALLERADARAGIIGRLVIQLAKHGEDPNMVESVPKTVGHVHTYVLPSPLSEDYDIKVKAALFDREVKA